MRKNNEIATGEWVDRRLAHLNATGDTEWQPNITRGLARFRQLEDSRGRRKWMLGATIAIAAFALAFVFQGPRDSVRRLWRDNFKSVDIGQVSASVKTLKDGQAAPDFTLKDSSGAEIRLSTYKGKVVLLNFWATWCEGCKMEIPWLMEFQNKYKASGFTVIGVSMDDDGWKSVRPFLKEEKLNYPVVIGNQEMAKPYGLGPMPMTFLIDRDGNVAATSVGIVNRAACESEILQLVAQSRKKL